MLFSETVLTKSFPIPAAVKPEEKKNLLAEKPEFKPIFFFCTVEKFALEIGGK